MSWFPKSSIVVPFDFSPQAKVAVETALDLVDSPSHVHVLHVLPELIPTEPGVIWSAVNDEERTIHAIDSMKEAFSDGKFQGVQFYAQIGDPGSTVAHFAEKQGAKLIVLPSHGRKGIARLLIGSVAERVVRLAHCPVLVLRGLSEGA